MADLTGAAYTRAMQRKRGFSILELTVAVGIIALLAALVMFTMHNRRAHARLARVTVELNTIASAMAKYAEDNNYQYPAEVARGLPPGLEAYLAGGQWPTGAWPNGLYDYDAWVHPGPGADLGRQIYQISYRLCDEVNDQAEACRDPILFPGFTHHSAIFYCISGPCVPHIADITAQAYCVNCTPKKQNY
jgi:prepilin-type N-terminal cleavage/methylation domain-containing protein